MYDIGTIPIAFIGFLDNSLKLEAQNGMLSISKSLVISSVLGSDEIH